ncbi:hypothetical protein GCM10020218_027690 [Dactylosporangium vinaceum]
MRAGERPELVAEVGLVEVAGGTGEALPQSIGPAGFHREHGGAKRWVRASRFGVTPTSSL